MIGANAEAIATAEDRERFKSAMVEIGLAVPASGIAHTIGGGAGGGRGGRPAGHHPSRLHPRRAGTGFASTMDELERVAAAGLAASPIREVLIESSIAGWKEFELEVMRDRADNCVVDLLDRERGPDGRPHQSPPRGTSSRRSSWSVDE